MKKRTFKLLHFTILFLLLFSNPLLSQDDNCIDSTQIDSLNMQIPCIQFSGYIENLFQPVCGCDSVTYSSSSCAYFNGITKTKNKPCSCIEPSFIDTTKNLLDFILYFYKDLPDPVKGCDGKYYPTPEMAVQYGGVTSFTRDSIPCKVQTYIDTTMDLSMFPDDPVCGCDKRTYRNKYEAFFYGGLLSWKKHRCNCIETLLIDTSIVCPDVYDPVCGCDRVTYQNQCVAENHYGVQYTKPGECPCIDSMLILSDSVFNSELNSLLFYRFNPVCGCDSITYYNYVVAQYYFGIAHWTKGPCQCIDTSQIDKNAPCSDIYHPVIGCDSVLYQNRCIARFRYGVMSFYNAPCYHEKQIDTTIDCDPHFNYDPVCGCDTITYPNECYAKYHAGLTKWYYGPCITDTTCRDTFLINPLKYCNDTYDPVCGCDSITYTNECIAKYRYGVKKWTRGKCTTSSSFLQTTGQNPVITYPDPFSKKLNLLFSRENIPDEIFISNIFGRRVYNEKIYSNSINHSIDLGFLNKGIYILSLKFDNITVSKKIIKI